MLSFERCAPRARIGLKGPRGAQWLAEQGIVLPLQPNTWTESSASAAVAAAPGAAAARAAYVAPRIGEALLVARLGASEFFLEAGGVAGAGVSAAEGDESLRRISSAVQAGIAGIYPVLREDAAFLLSGDGAADVLAQVCSVNFAALDLGKQPVIMTMMIGVSVLMVPQAADGGVRYLIWCDPTFGSYLDAAVGTVVSDCGGSHGGGSA